VKALLFRALLAAGVALLLTNVAIVFLIESSASTGEPPRPTARDATRQDSPAEGSQRQQTLSGDCQRSGTVHCLEMLPMPSPRATAARTIVL
jgi:hypothetical protein